MSGRFQSVWMDLLLVSITVMMLQPQEVSGGENLKMEVLKKCKDFKSNNEERKTVMLLPTSTDGKDTSSSECTNFWDKFHSAFIKKNPVDVVPEAYRELINAEPIIVEEDKLLLWSKTGSYIKWLSDQKEPHFFSIKNTIFSILDEVKMWCGAKDKTDVLTENCPEYKTPVNPVKSYWRSVSAALAKAAKGTVTVLLDGSIETPYDSNSIFATDELPNLDQKETALHVLLVQNVPDDKICDNASIKQLKKSWKYPNYECRYAAWSQLKEKSPAEWWKAAKLSRRNSIR